MKQGNLQKNWLIRILGASALTGLVAIIALILQIVSSHDDDIASKTQQAYQAIQIAQQQTQIALAGEQNQLQSQQLTLVAQQSNIESQLLTPVPSGISESSLTAVMAMIQSTQIEATSQAIATRQKAIEATQTAIESRSITPVYLSEIKPRTATVGFMDFSIGKYSFTSPDASDKIKKGDPIVAHGIQYTHGLYAHAPSKLTYELHKQYSELLVTIVLVDWIECGDGAEFVIKLDNNELYRSKRMIYSSLPENVKVDVTDGNLLELITEKGSYLECDWTIWGDPILY